jgi:hypothetical protein
MRIYCPCTGHLSTLYPLKVFSEDTVSFLRPRRRRAESTRLPLGVAMRALKPCLFLRFLILGWYVGLPIIVFKTGGKGSNFLRCEVEIFQNCFSRACPRPWGGVGLLRAPLSLRQSLRRPGRRRAVPAFGRPPHPSRGGLYALHGPVRGGGAPAARPPPRNPVTPLTQTLRFLKLRVPEKSAASAPPRRRRKARKAGAGMQAGSRQSDRQEAPARRQACPAPAADLQPETDQAAK